MAKVTVNFQGIIDYDVPVEPGAYHVKITKAELKDSKKKGGYPGVNIQATILEGPDVNRKLFCYCTTNPELSEKGFKKNFMLFNLLKCLGLADKPEDLDFDTDDLVNQEMVWVMDINPDDNTQNTVTKFERLD